MRDNDDGDLDSTDANQAAAAVIAELQARDDELGNNAEAAWSALTWGQGIGSITQAQVQLFLWYQLPLNWVAPDEYDLLTKMAAAAAALLDGLGLDRYAAICRSPETAEVHAAYGRSEGEGRRAFLRAVDRSGIEPPDIEDLAWGSRMGTDEACAQSMVAVVLEHAIGAGELVPGARGWRQHQRALTSAALDQPHPTLPTQTWRNAIVTERLEHWVSFAHLHSEASRALRARHVNRLLVPIPVPGSAGELLAPFVWLLGEALARDGLALTQTGALNRALVVEGAERWGWWDFDRSQPNREDDVWQLGALHRLARNSGAVRRRHRRLQLTPLGRRTAADPAAAWHSVVPWLAGDDEFGQMMAEACTLVLLDQPSRAMAADSLWPPVAALAGEQGWRVGGRGGRGGEAPREQDVRWATRSWLALGDLFGFVHEDGDWRSQRIRVTPPGEAAMLAYLRSRAASPRSGPIA